MALHDQCSWAQAITATPIDPRRTTYIGHRFHLLLIQSYEAILVFLFLLFHGHQDGVVLEIQRSDGFRSRDIIRFSSCVRDFEYNNTLVRDKLTSSTNR